MNYETNSFGMDVLFSIKAQSTPYSKTFMPQETEINELFIQDLTQRNKEAEYFLSEYYSSGFEIPEEHSSFCLKEEYSVFELKIKAEENCSWEGIKFEEGDSEPVKNEEF